MAKKYFTLNLEGEKVYVRKSVFGWGVIHPIKIEGKIVWKNLIAGGNWWNLLALAFILFIIFGAISEFASAIELANKCVESINLANDLLSNEYWNPLP